MNGSGTYCSNGTIYHKTEDVNMVYSRQHPFWAYPGDNETPNSLHHNSGDPIQILGLHKISSVRSNHNAHQTAKEASHPSNYSIFSNKKHFHIYKELQIILPFEFPENYACPLYILVDKRRSSSLKTYSSANRYREDPRVLPIEQRRLSLGIETMMLLHRKHLDSQVIILTVRSTMNDDRKKINICERLQNIRRYLEQYDSKKVPNDMIFLFALYVKKFKISNSIGTTAMMMPMIINDRYQYNSSITPSSYFIVKFSKYFIINFKIITYQLTKKSNSEKTCYECELYLPDEENYTTFLKEDFIVYHMDQTLLVEFTHEIDGNLYFTMHQMLNDEVLISWLPKYTFISSSDRNYIQHKNRLIKHSSTFDKLERQIYYKSSPDQYYCVFQDRSQILSNSPINDSQFTFNNQLIMDTTHETLINTAEDSSLCTYKISNDRGDIQADDLSSQTDHCMTILAMELLHKENLDCFLALLHINMIRFYDGTDSMVLDEYEYLRCFPPFLSSEYKQQNHSFFFSLFNESPKKSGSIGKTVLLMPMTYKGSLQYNEYIELDPTLDIKCGNCFIINLNISFLIKKNEMLPGQKIHVVKFFLPHNRGVKYF